MTETLLPKASGQDDDRLTAHARHMELRKAIRTNYSKTRRHLEAIKI